jgi:glycosyltransferase involved in cell wall biosynthesis
MVGFQPLNLVPYFLSVMDVFLLPAHWEGFGNVLIQAAAMGVPIIATDVTGVKDAVSANYNGILVPQGNHDALVEAMHQIVNDKSLRDKLGSNGILWSQNFHPEIIWNGYVELFEEPIIL